jgi:hypothetical protein
MLRCLNKQEIGIHGVVLNEAQGQLCLFLTRNVFSSTLVLGFYSQLGPIRWDDTEVSNDVISRFHRS